MTPVEVRAPLGARLLEVVWDDGNTTFFRHLVLRGFCPCAVCQGHEGAIQWVEPSGDSALALTQLHETGQYGLRLEWGDGHATGIYSFTYLQDLAALHEVAEGEVRAKVFRRP